MSQHSALNEVKHWVLQCRPAGETPCSIEPGLDWEHKRTGHAETAQHTLRLDQVKRVFQKPLTVLGMHEWLTSANSGHSPLKDCRGSTSLSSAVPTSSHTSPTVLHATASVTQAGSECDGCNGCSDTLRSCCWDAADRGAVLAVPSVALGLVLLEMPNI